MVFGKKITLSTKGFSDIKDITGEVEGIVMQSGIKNGLVNVFIVGSTASVSTIEYEPALVEDMRQQLEEFIPASKNTRHSQTWGDDNGFSHLRATFMGPGICLPLSDGQLVLGTWQQIIVIDHDNRPRSRDVFIQVMGEK
ncbi:MAG: secondary thiamine-phosphate synthase enzyme YjbQ [Actinomycetota bacterium]|nr:secondary thiamine-phosphate synthase enzyme YjbQ [Actinomycetota bacterium]